MEQQIYHGLNDPNALAQHLLDTWDQGDTVVQALESDEGIIVQVGQRSGGLFSDAPRSALTIALEPVRQGMRVSIGEQQWYRDGGGQIMVGGLIGFFPFFFTWPLGGGRAEPVDPALTREVWDSIERYAQTAGSASAETTRLPREQAAMTGETTRLPTEQAAMTGATTRLPSTHCPACGVANLPGVARCDACGTYMQASDCPTCGVSNPATANFCIRCGSSLGNARSVGG